MSGVRLAAALVLILALSGSAIAQEDPAPSPDATATTKPDDVFEGLAPPEIDGIEWVPLRTVTGSDILRTFEGEELEDWVLLLEAMEAGPEALIGLDARAAFPAAPQEAGGFSAIRIVGADEDRFRAVLLDWIATRRGVGPVEVERVSIAGRHVDVLTLSLVQQGHLYVAGDTAYAVFVPPEYVRAIIRELPEATAHTPGGAG